MACGVGYTFLVFSVILLTGNGVGGKNDPKIFTKDGSVHIRSGDNGNIVFEHPSTEGKVIVSGQELNFINSTGPKGEKGARGSPGVNGTLGVKGRIGDKGEPGIKGDKGEQGDQGRPGYNGTIGTRGVKGEPGPPGPAGQNGTDGVPGLKGDPGDSRQIGPKGDIGPPGPNGLQGRNGTAGEKGANGTQGIPGLKGEKGDAGDIAYFRGNASLQCNDSNFGILRYSSTKLQLCTPRGWRSLSFEAPIDCSKYLDVPDVPETNYQMFLNADFGVMFQFNKNFAPTVNSRVNLNITADIHPVNSTLSYQNAVMRQAVLFDAKARLNISAISDDFWRHSNWSVMALLKYKDIGQNFVRVLGHGTTNNNQGLHLGIVVKDKHVIHGYYSNDMKFGKVDAGTWYHITWTSEKLQGSEERCININGVEHKCEKNVKQAYSGSGTTTVGAWWHEKYADHLVLDNLIITSGVVQYTAAEKQVCFAKMLDANLP